MNDPENRTGGWAQHDPQLRAHGGDLGRLGVGLLVHQMPSFSSEELFSVSHVCMGCVAFSLTISSVLPSLAPVVV